MKSMLIFPVLCAGLSAHNTVNIKDYGAVCNGTTDDTAAIASAILASSGKTLNSPDGTCVHSPLTVSVPIHIELSPRSIWKLKVGSTGRQMTVTASKVTIRGGTLDGNSAANSGASDGIFVNSGLSDINFDGVTFINHKASNIRVKGMTGPETTRLSIRNCMFSGAGSAAAVFFNWEVTGSEIINNRFLAGAHNAIWAGNGSRDIRVQDNNISGYSRMGIEIWAAGTAALGHRDARATVSGNKITLTGGLDSFGISISDAGQSVVVGNTVNLTTPLDGSIGIELIRSHGSVVWGNVVVNSGRPITVDKTNDAVVSGNTVLAFTGAEAIHVTTSEAPYTANRNVISSNRIIVTRTTGNPIGIWLQANSSPGAVSENIITANIISGQNTATGVGIQLSQNSGTLIKNHVSLNTISTLNTGIYQTGGNPSLNVYINNVFNSVVTETRTTP